MLRTRGRGGPPTSPKPDGAEVNDLGKAERGRGVRGLTVAQAAERGSPLIFQIAPYATLCCTSNIEMTPLCKVKVTLARVLGSWGMRRDGGVDEQAGVQPA